VVALSNNLQGSPWLLLTLIGQPNNPPVGDPLFTSLVNHFLCSNDLFIIVSWWNLIHVPRSPCLSENSQ